MFGGNLPPKTGINESSILKNKTNVTLASKAGNETLLLAPIDTFKEVQINKGAILNNWIQG